MMMQFCTIVYFNDLYCLAIPKIRKTEWFRMKRSFYEIHHISLFSANISFLEFETCHVVFLIPNSAEKSNFYKKMSKL